MNAKDQQEGPAVVLDTNLFVAAFWNRQSASAESLLACLEGRAHLYYTPQIKAEIKLILRNIKASNSYKQLVAQVLNKGTEIRPSVSVAVAEDPEDEKFLACAVEAHADYLITTDEHLLKLKVFNGVRIIKPTEFHKVLQSARQGNNS